MSLIGVARCIKQRRQQLGLTLEQIAVRTGLTRSVLSKVENFRVTPSLQALAKIAEALETTVSDLTREVGEPHAISVVLKGQGVRLEREQPKTRLEYELLTDKSTGTLESLLISLPDTKAREVATSHEGEEFLHVISGQITLRYGDEAFDLQEGDSAHFNASIPHSITNRGEQPAKVLCTFGSSAKGGYCPKCSARLFFLSNNPNGSEDSSAYRLFE